MGNYRENENAEYTQPELAHRYVIRVQGKVNESWADWFEDVSVSFSNSDEGTPVTVVRGVMADQVALRGLLTRIWDLNLSVISLYRVDCVDACCGGKQ